MLLESEGPRGNVATTPWRYLPAQNPYNKEEQATVSRKRRLPAGIVPELGSNSAGRICARGEIHPEELIRVFVLYLYAYRYAIMAV